MFSNKVSNIVVEVSTPFQLVPTLAIFGVIEYVNNDECEFHKKLIENLNEDLFELTPEDKPLFFGKLSYYA